MGKAAIADAKLRNFNHNTATHDQPQLKTMTYIGAGCGNAD
jgi:hypothetical protein